MLCAIPNLKLFSIILGRLPISPLSPTEFAPQLLSILGHLIFIFILSGWACLTCWTVFLCSEPFWLVHYPAKKNTWTLPKTKVSLEDGVNPLWSTYIREKMITLGKNKCGTIRNIWGNTFETWGPCENLKGRHWEQEKSKKIQCPPPPSPKGLTLGLLNACSIALLPG
jgi:hypothetical protein